MLPNKWLSGHGSNLIVLDLLIDHPVLQSEEYYISIKKKSGGFI